MRLKRTRRLLLGLAMLALALPMSASAEDFDPSEEFELNDWVPIHLGPLVIDLSPTKHVVFLLLAAIITIGMFTIAKNGIQRARAAGKAPSGFAGIMEAFALFEALSHRMVADGIQAGWHGWPAEYHERHGPAVLGFAAAHAGEVAFHAWLQHLADEQLAHAQAAARAAGMRIGLYLDLAVGTAPDGAATWADPKLAMTGACGLCGGIARANRNVLQALVEISDEQSRPLTVLSLLERSGDRPPLPEGARFHAFAGSKSKFSLALLRACVSRPLICFDHVTLALPVLPLAAAGVVKAVIFAHGSEAWKRVRRSSRGGHTFRSVARRSSLPDGKSIAPVERPASASRSSATSLIVTSAASGPRKCRTS